MAGPYYVGPGGNNASAGTAYSTRRLTLTSIETLVASGDIVYCSPGTFRETLTVTASGGSSYTTGTVSVTNGSATVTGSGTTFTGNAFANGVFRIHTIASGTDGVTNGTATFTSTAGNFQSAMIGMTIRINTKAAYIISAVASATSITLKNIDGSAPSPSSASSLTYNVGPEAPYDISTVDSNTQLTLKSVWTGPTLTGVAYETWKDIRYIADVTGQNTDGVGGIVRVTGSDNDTSATRNSVIVGSSKNYRTFQGFHFDSSASSHIVFVTSGANWIIQDCVLSQAGTSTSHIRIDGASQANATIRRCVLIDALSGQPAVLITHTATLNNVGHLIENCLLLPNRGGTGVENDRVGGTLIRNCTFRFCSAVLVSVAQASGQALTVNNCIIQNANVGIQGTATTDILEDYNNISGAATARSGTTTGSNSTAVLPMFNPPLLVAGEARFPWLWSTLAPWSTLVGKAGNFEAGDDLFGLLRPTTSAKRSWGAIQFVPAVRNVATTHAGAASLQLTDAGRFQMTVPTTNISTTISVYCYREANYAGTNPAMVIHQPGQADITVTDAGSASAWNQLTTTFTPAASPGYVIIELVSANSSSSGSFSCYWDDLVVS